MSKTSQLLLGFFLFMTTVFTVISLTVLNKHFVYMIENKSKLSVSMAKEMNMKNEEAKKHIRTYIESDYQESILQKNERKYLFLGNQKEIKRWKWVIYVCTFCLLIMTGNLFLMTKKEHQLSFLFLISGVLLILFFGVCVIIEPERTILFHTLYQAVIHILLGIGIIFIEISWVKQRKVKKLS